MYDSSFVDPFVAKETLMIGFVSFVMLLGTFLKYLQKKIGLPYCPSLLFIGMIMGYWVDDFNSIFIHASVIRISIIDPVNYFL